MENKNLFDDKSKLYKSARPLYPESLYRHLSNLCHSRDLAWDCACGNGQAAESLAKIFDKVAATDISEQQIKNAQYIKNVEYAISPAEHTEFPDNAFDLICVAQALHWFELETFWPEVKRVLKPNGVFSAWGYTWPSISPELDSIFRKLILDVIEPYWASQNSLLWNHYSEIDFPFQRIDSPYFKMGVNWNLNEFFDFIHTFSATRKCMEEQGTTFFKIAFDTMEKIWGGAENRKAINLDFIFYAGK